MSIAQPDFNLSTCFNWTAFYVESGVIYLKFDGEHYGDPIVR